MRGVLTTPHARGYSAAMSSSIEKGHGWLLVAVCTSLFFMPFMMAGVNAVLPPLGQSLHASARELGLMGAFYSMGLAVFQLASGSMATSGVTAAYFCGVSPCLPLPAPCWVLSILCRCFCCCVLCRGWAGPCSTPAVWPCWPRLLLRGGAPPILVTADRQYTRALPADRLLRALWPGGLAGNGCSGAALWRPWACCC